MSRFHVPERAGVCFGQLHASTSDRHLADDRRPIWTLFASSATGIGASVVGALVLLLCWAATGYGPLLYLGIAAAITGSWRIGTLVIGWRPLGAAPDSERGALRGSSPPSEETPSLPVDPSPEGQVLASDGAATAQPVATLPFDHSAFSGLVDMMGRESMNLLLDRLLAQLDLSLDGNLSPQECERLAADVHGLVSAAGMLGFRALSEACRELEHACRGDGDVALSLGRLRESRARAIDEIARLKVAA